MGRFTAVCTALWVAGASLGAGFGPAAAEFAALARLDPDRSDIVDTRRWVTVTLTLSQPVPYRIETWRDPMRLVIELRTVDLARVALEGLDASERILAVTDGTERADRARLVLDLAQPLQVTRAGMVTGASDGSARIEIALEPTDAAGFDARARAPDGDPKPAVAATRADRLRVVLDPGHGGVDPGAIRDGVEEADVMLTFARDLREVLRRSGAFDVVLTRDADVFLSLRERVDFAKRAGADVFLSLHADAIAEGIARGAQVYTLSETATSVAAAQLAARHARADLFAGADLSSVDEQVGRVLMELAWAETRPRSAALADALVDGLAGAGIRMHARAREQAQFTVLTAPDIPSALIEVGFLSSPGELAKLQSAAWRAQAAAGIAAGLSAWAEEMAARAEVLRR